MDVLITGGAGGLGRALAVECAKRGYRIFLTDIALQPLQSIQHGLTRQFDASVSVCACDMTQPEQVKEMLKSANQEGWKFQMLLNVAGVDHEGAFAGRESCELLDIIKVNIEATLAITHESLAYRNKKVPFYIVFVSSLASLYPMPLKATYAASKRFLLDLSIALGRELEKEQVSIMALCPGGLATTPGACAGIQAQGLWGQITTNRLEQVAHRTIAKVLRGKKIYIPGAVNKGLSVAGKLVPNRWIAKLLYLRWKGARSKWLEPTH